MAPTTEKAPPSASAPFGEAERRAALGSAEPLAPPVGMRDLLPPEAAERRRLVRRLAERFQRYGYALVTTPPFELAEVFERAEGSFDRRDHLRFVDADTGEVALLRPDITPQIARLVATRLADRPPPLRLAYEGHVIRRRRGRARRQRQIAQAGVECIGVPGTAGDAEVTALLADALEAVGLASFSIELALVPLPRMVLARVDAARRDDATEALAKKDRASLARILTGEAKATRDALLGATELVGDASVLDLAARVFPGREAAGMIASLRALVRRVTDLGLGSRLAFDLGEVRGFGYYTGPSFSVLAAGPGEPIGGGGRYDALLGRFGRALPATGFALDVGHLDWALAVAGRGGPALEGVAVVGGLAPEVLGALRDGGLAVTELGDVDDAAASAWASAWGVRFVCDARAKKARVVDRADGARADLAGERVRQWIVGRATTDARRGSERGNA